MRSNITKKGKFVYIQEAGIAIIRFFDLNICLITIRFFLDFI